MPLSPKSDLQPKSIPCKNTPTIILHCTKTHQIEVEIAIRGKLDKNTSISRGRVMDLGTTLAFWRLPHHQSIAPAPSKREKELRQRTVTNAAGEPWERAWLKEVGDGEEGRQGRGRTRGEGAYQVRRTQLLRRATAEMLFIVEGKGKCAKRGGNPNQFPPSLRMHAGS